MKKRVAIVTGAGGVGYDDMVCGDGSTCGGIWQFGTWVNGGVWTTTEGRWLLAAARVGDILPAFESLRTMLALYADTWRMDNPLVDFGRSPVRDPSPTLFSSSPLLPPASSCTRIDRTLSLESHRPGSTSPTRISTSPSIISLRRGGSYEDCLSISTRQQA